MKGKKKSFLSFKYMYIFLFDKIYTYFSGPVLVDVDFLRRVFDEIMVERDRYAFKLVVVYERFFEFCSNYQMIGHDVTTCS